MNNNDSGLLVDSTDIRNEYGTLWRNDIEASIEILLFKINFEKCFELIELYIQGEKRSGVVVCSDDERLGSPNFRTNVVFTVDGRLFAYPCRYDPGNCRELNLDELCSGDIRDLELVKSIFFGMQKLTN